MAMAERLQKLKLDAVEEVAFFATSDYRLPDYR